MSEENNTIEKPESLFLNERLMAAVAGGIAVGGFISLFFFRAEMDPFEKFGLLIKLLTAVAIYFTFRSYNWDVTKGLLGGVLFSLMYLEAYLVFAKLWSQDFDTYLVAGVAGSIYLAAAGMSLWMTESIDASSMLPQEILPGDQTVVYNTGPLYVIFPEYSDIDHVVENRPSQSDDSITWCSSAGWNYSWYRQASGKVLELFGFSVPWSHNWVVFRK